MGAEEFLQHDQENPGAKADECCVWLGCGAGSEGPGLNAPGKRLTLP